MNTVYTKAQTDNGLSTTLQQAKAYSDDKASEASLLFATKAERADGDAATYASMKSYVDAYAASAALTFAAQSSLNGVSATAALALTTAQDAATKLNEARVRLVAAAGGGNPAVVELYSDASGASDIRLLARQIQLGENTILDTSTGLETSYFGTTRRVVAKGAAFGASPDANQLTEWEGPNGVAFNAMTRANAYYFRANTDPRHGGSAVAGGVPFKVTSTHRSIGQTRSGAGIATTALVTFAAQGATGPVSFDVYFVDGDNTVTATNTSSEDSTAPFEHQTAFRATLAVGQQKTARLVCAVRDAAGNSGAAYVSAGLNEAT